jgi:hypothetical protein
VRPADVGPRRRRSPSGLCRSVHTGGRWSDHQPCHRIPLRSPALGTPHHPHDQYRNPAELACGASAHPSARNIGFHAGGRADYYLSHDWAPGRSPRDTTWSLLVGTARTGLVLARTKVDIDTAVSYAVDLQSRRLATA